jgi:uncharacterized protein YbaR (Trm112 family)
MITNEILTLLVCPESRQPLKRADVCTVARLKDMAENGLLQTVTGKGSPSEFEDILVREDGAVGYLVRGGIPLLLADHGISISQSLQAGRHSS